MDPVINMCFIGVGIGAAIGVLYACIFYGIPLLIEIFKAIIDFIKVIPELFETGIDGFKKGWNRHSSEQQN